MQGAEPQQLVGDLALQLAGHFGGEQRGGLLAERLDLHHPEVVERGQDPLAIGLQAHEADLDHLDGAQESHGGSSVYFPFARNSPITVRRMSSRSRASSSAPLVVIWAARSFPGGEELLGLLLRLDPGDDERALVAALLLGAHLGEERFRLVVERVELRLGPGGELFGAGLGGVLGGLHAPDRIERVGPGGVGVLRHGQRRCTEGQHEQEAADGGEAEEPDEPGHARPARHALGVGEHGGGGGGRHADGAGGERPRHSRTPPAPSCA